MTSYWKNACGSLSVLLATLFLLMTVAGAQAAENAGTLDVRPQKGFARLVFTFDKIPEITSQTVSTIFVLKFKKPVVVDLSPVAVKLPRVITVARRDPDGYALRFAMSRDFKVNVLKAGHYLIVDFLSKRWVGRPPGIPQDIVDKLAQEAEKARLAAKERERQEALLIDPLRVEVHDARQPTFNRISFNWNRFVTAELTRKGELVKILFGGRAIPDLAPLRANLPSNLVAVQHKAGRDSLQIIMKVTKGTGVRAFREGRNYVVDLTIAKPAAVSGVAASLYAAAGGAEKARAPAREQVTLLDNSAQTQKAAPPAPPPPQEAKVRTGEAGAKTAPPVPQRPVRKKTINLPAKLSGDEKASSPEPSGQGRLAEPAALPEEATVKAEDKKSRRVLEKKQSHEKVRSPAKPRRATKARGTFEPGRKTAQAQEQGRQTLRGDNDNRRNRIEVVRNENSVQLRFPFAKNRVAAAIFQRNENLWIVIDHTKKLDLSGLKEELGGIVNTIRHEQLDKSQLIEFGLSGPWLSSVSQQDSNWNFSIGDLVTGSSGRFTPAKRVGASGGEELFIPTRAKGRMHQIVDLNSGDDLLVITSTGPAKSIRKLHEHVEFQLFRTIHGIVVRPLTDDLQVTRNDEGVRIVGNTGLYLSGKAAPVGKGMEMPRNKRQNRARNLKFNSPEGRDIAKFIKYTLELEKRIAEKGGRVRKRARLELARHWLSRGFAPEALGMLEIAASENVELTRDPVFRLMRGMANILLRRFKEGAKDLEANDLVDNPHASLWRGYSAYMQRKFDRASAELKRGAAVIGSYLPRRQAVFRLAGADVAIENGAPVLAGTQLDEMPKTGVTPLQQSMARFLEGRLMELENKPREALQLYVDATRAKIRPVTARAVFHLTDLRLRIGDIKSSVGIDILERLSIVWRGDEVELQVLHRLADLYLEKGRYNDAFTLMKTAVQAYPRSEQALALQDRMKAQFKELFLEGKADSLAPIKALALFYDHKYLTPPGRIGDEMIRRLADRLIDVDLLDKAAGLLEHQVKRRLKGAGRAQVAIRLAMIHLLQRRPKKALKAIYRTRQPGLPAQVKQARRLLEARAYAELGRSGPALELLAGDESSEAGEIRALALWRGQKWSKAGEEYEKLLGDSWLGDKPLSSKERVQVLRAAISYTLGSDPLGLGRLREKYATKMAGGTDAEAFTLITDPLKSDARAIDRLARDIADIDTLEAFIKAFRQRLELTGGPQTTSAVR